MTNEKIIIKNIRVHAAAFGYDLSAISDKRIKDSVVKFNSQIKKVGISTEQVGNAFRKLSIAINETMPHNKTLNPTQTQAHQQ